MWKINEYSNANMTYTRIYKYISSYIQSVRDSSNISYVYNILISVQRIINKIVARLRLRIHREFS